MRAFDLALLFICIQIGLGVVYVFGGFGNVPYESKITNVKVIKGNVTSTETYTNITIQNQNEETGFLFDFIGRIKNILTWDWLKDVNPFYYIDAGSRAMTDFIIAGLRAITFIILAWAVLTMIFMKR